MITRKSIEASAAKLYETELQAWRDRVLVDQSFLLLEIRDLLAEAALKLANPVQVVDVAPLKPGRTLRRRFRTTWICKQEGKVTFKCVDCRRLVEVSEDQMRGLPGPWIPLHCRHCNREFELDARELDGETGLMMRAFFPDEPEEVGEEEKGPGKIEPSKPMCEPCAQGNCRKCLGYKVCGHYHRWEGETEPVPVLCGDIGPEGDVCRQARGHATVHANTDPCQERVDGYPCRKRIGHVGGHIPGPVPITPVTDPVFCDKPIPVSAILTCKRHNGHRGDCWASR